MRLGDFSLHLVSDGGFRLDGGAMFGVVPRVLWQRRKPPDEQNRIQMTTNCLLVETADDLVLIDTGLGDKGDEKFNRMFALEEGARRLPDSIRAAGFAPGDITHVISSHLHFDHSGWNTRHTGEGLVPTFPRARYWLEAGEVDHARRPSERDRASYDERNWEPLFAAGVVELFREAAEPVAGIKVLKVPGHNADMCIVRLSSGGEEAVFWADLVPTAAHLPNPWIMAYDLYPLATLENKKKWLPRACEGGWLCIFEHDPETPWAYLEETAPGCYAARPISGMRRVDG